MPVQLPDSAQANETWLHEGVSDFIYVPLAWRTGQSQFAGRGPDTEIEEALKDLHAAYLDLPIPDRLLDLVRRA